MPRKNGSVNSVDIPFICESMHGYVWALSETLTDGCDYLTSWLTSQMPDTFSVQLQAGRRLSLRFRLTISFPLSFLLLLLVSSFIIYHSFLLAKVQLPQHFDTFVRNTSQRYCASGEFVKKLYPFELKAIIVWNTFKAKIYNVVSKE